MVIILRTFIILTKGKYGGYKLHSILNDNLFFNHLIQIMIESLFEFQISAYLNILGMIQEKQIKFNESGEILGALLSVFCISTSYIILPSLLIWVTTLKLEVL
jgi:hypothetical protein